MIKLSYNTEGHSPMMCIYSVYQKVNYCSSDQTKEKNLITKKQKNE